MTNNQESYERAVLAGMLIYNDARPIGYLKPLNFVHKTEGILNADIFRIFSESDDLMNRIKSVQKLGNYALLMANLTQYRGEMCDLLGINTPKYCLHILEIELRKKILECLVRLSDGAETYKIAVENVFHELSLSDGFFLTDAQNSMAYFTHIGFERGALAFDELILQYDARIKQINQNYEIEKCISRLLRYCEDKGKPNLLSDLQKIKAELTL